ncbi:MAG: hypothetical protein ACREOE_05375, partial [Gemmatimonadales bacterium]
MMLRKIAISMALLLLAACASRSTGPMATEPTPVAGAAPADSALHVGATVRVRASGLGRGWRVGTIAVSTGLHPCLAVKLAALHAGAPFYVPVSRLSRLQADSRTNTGALTLGLPPAAESDWAPVSIARAAS